MIAMIIFDLCETVLITVMLAITIPFACFVYWKLLVVFPFAENFTFKLIILNGATSLISGVTYLIVFQLCSYSFMYNFYDFVRNNNLSTAVCKHHISLYVMIYKNAAITNIFFNKMSLHSALFVAMNRLKTVLSLRQKGNDFTFFLFSFLCSLILTLPAVIDLCAFTTQDYKTFEYLSSRFVVPSSTTKDETLVTISNALTVGVSFATLIVNIILVVYLVKERQHFELPENRKFNVEVGLMVTSVVSYVFYMLFFINSMVAKYWQVPFSAGAQFLFLGLSALTPFWCLIVFTPSIRRLLLTKKNEVFAMSIAPSSIVV